jgi:hypothetical protein
MSYKAKPWPYHANGALEDVLSLLKDAERATGQAQRAAVEGDSGNALVSMSDIRTQIMLAYGILIMAKSGHYPKDS